MKKQKYKQSVRGFSMLEVAVVLMIASVVLVSLLPILLDARHEEERRVTLNRLAKIEEALQLHVDVYTRLPCPADMTLPVDDADFAKEGGTDDVTDGSCMDGSITASWQSGNTAGGMVPTRALHLPDSYAFDGWGQRFAYHVAERLTAAEGIARQSCDGDITVEDQQGGIRTSNAAYVLLSYGLNGDGSFGRAGTKRGVVTTSDGEIQNSETDGDYDNVFHQSVEYKQDLSDPLSSFDDLVRYRQKFQLAEPFRYAYTMATAYHGCALSNHGRAYCWGKGDYGNLGNGTTVAEDPTPRRVTHPNSNRKFEQLTVGDHHTCALDDNRNTYCWGWNNWGQIGDNTTDNRSVPTLVDMSAMPLGVQFKHISAGGGHNCALATNDQIYCWGYDNDGKMGIGTTGSQYRPQTPVSLPGGVTSWKAVDVGKHHACAIGDNDLSYCWGRGVWSGEPSAGRMGDGSTNSSNPTPRLVSMPANVDTVFISAGGATTCAMGSDGRAYCWGEGSDGQIGDGNNLDRGTPTPVSTGGMVYTSIESGLRGVCATQANGTAYCWGAGANGEIGDGGVTASSNTPVAVTYPAGVWRMSKVYNGVRHACGYNNQWAYCWGHDEYGKLGNGGSNTDLDVPTPLANPADACGL